MTRKELLKYCRYYKGETECPFKIGSDEGTFWVIESMYVDDKAGNNGNEYWEARAEYTIKKHPEMDNLLTRKDVSIHTKGIAMYVEAMLQTWRPYDVGMIFRY